MASGLPCPIAVIYAAEPSAPSPSRYPPLDVMGNVAAPTVHVGAVMQNDICRSSSFPFASQTAAALDSCSLHAAMLSAAGPWIMAMDRPTGHCSPYPACCPPVSPAFGRRMRDEDRTRQFVSPRSSGQSRNQPLAPCRLGLSSVRARPLPACSLS